MTLLRSGTTAGLSAVLSDASYRETSRGCAATRGYREPLLLLLRNPDGFCGSVLTEPNAFSAKPSGPPACRLPFFFR